MGNKITGFFTMKFFLALFLAMSVVLNIMLARKIGRLNQAVAASEALQSLTVGTTVPALEAKELNGSKVVVNYSETERPTLIYVFTPQCMWCSRNLENIKALSSGIAQDYRVIGISLTSEDLPEYVAKNHFDFPVYTKPSTGTKTNYKLGATPRTIVVSPGGEVLKTWNGTYSGDLKPEIEDFFHVTLPGIGSDLASK
jgi:peroxiredoxin